MNQRRRSKARALRDLLNGEQVVRVVGAHDAMTARLIELGGFEAVWASSLELSASHGVPDSGLLTMTQYLDAAENMDAAGSIPVVADCDTGFGGPLNVGHLVRRYEKRGIAAICIEDKQFPKMNSFADVAHPLVPTADFVEKISAGKAAQVDPDFVFIARTEAFIAGLGLGEAMDRAHAYADAGADAILVHSRADRPDQVLEFAAEWTDDVPLVAVPTTYHGVSEQGLFRAGYRMVIYANHIIRAQVKAVSEMLEVLKRSGCAGAVEPDIVPMDTLFELQGMTAAFRTQA